MRRANVISYVESCSRSQPCTCGIRRARPGRSDDGGAYHSGRVQRQNDARDGAPNRILLDYVDRIPAERRLSLHGRKQHSRPVLHALRAIGRMSDRPRLEQRRSNLPHQTAAAAQCRRKCLDDGTHIRCQVQYRHRYDATGVSILLQRQSRVFGAASRQTKTRCFRALRACAQRKNRHARNVSRIYSVGVVRVATRLTGI